MTTYSLIELNTKLRQTVERGLSDDYWLETEIMELRTSRGHCYMEFVEKSALDNSIIARSQAVCWQSVWGRLLPAFVAATGVTPHAGIKLRLLVRAQYHVCYGFKWIVADIDPTYTLGDLARRRRETLKRLADEGVIDLNKEQPLTLCPTRIAVVSSETAAGYGDFTNHLRSNARGFRFRAELFPAVMQGDATEASVIEALNAIFARSDEFDCVVIIRGGGATADLAAFDSLALAENVANFPLPVIAGIGHDRDQSVVDRVAFLSVKTPTAAAAFLIDRLTACADSLADLRSRMAAAARARLERGRFGLERAASRVGQACRLRLADHRRRLDLAGLRAASAARARIAAGDAKTAALALRARTAAERLTATAAHRLEMLSARAAALDPALPLKRGYSITLLDGKALRRAADAPKGTRLTTRLAEGEISSEVL